MIVKMYSVQLCLFIMIIDACSMFWVRCILIKLIVHRAAIFIYRNNIYTKAIITLLFLTKKNGYIVCILLDLVILYYYT